MILSATVSDVQHNTSPKLCHHKNRPCVLWLKKLRCKNYTVYLNRHLRMPLSSSSLSKIQHT